MKKNHNLGQPFFVRFLIVVVVLLCLSIASFFYLINSSSFWKTTAPQLINSRLKDISISSLDFDSLQADFPLLFKFEKLKSKVIVGGVDYAVEIDNLEIAHLSNYFKRSEPIDIIIEGLNVESRQTTLYETNVNLDVFNYSNGKMELSGAFKSLEMISHKYRLHNLSSKIVGNENELVFEDFFSNFYAGDIQGVIAVGFDEHIPYRVKLKLRHVDVGRLQKVNSNIYSNLDAFINADINLQAEKKEIKDLNVALNTLGGGEVKASLFKYLMDYIPPSSQGKELEALIKEDGRVPVENAVIKLNSIDLEKASVDLLIESKKLNLNAEVAIDVNVEGGLHNLLKQMEKLSS